ncbi:LpxI family protein [Pinisolibacter aquiterrae]|uniref:LpxI family protein n=1 Tax=Pinisolibacter aquiterrae TaxID=2815579 RepID=UPI001E6166D1|nr:UDP-2,3-diacylglucosamine diphosphatase LpxI [Pinisolibacter aquiterrae]MCC8234554.1 UDP-2,3-diacylglucosamine diphosphatase LpxI [Pinisolibacter aquiterrae]
MPAATGSRSDAEGPLVILAGGGRLPLLVAEGAAARGRRVTIAGILGEADPAIEAHDHVWIGRGHLSRLIRLARARGARDLVIIGGMKERRMPRLSEFDLADLFELIRNWRLLTHGEDGILRRLARLFEARGLRVVGAGEVVPDLLMPAGPLGVARPSEAHLQTIAFGAGAARGHGLGDVGQGVIVTGRTVVLKEGFAGTDAMIDAFSKMPCAREKRGILVKCPKPIQDPRLDQPVIGAETVRAAAEAGLEGVAVEAGATLVADREALIRLADAAGLFVWGFTDEAAPIARGEGA